MNGSMLALWIAVALLATVLIGAGAGALAWWETKNAPRSLLVAGSAAGAALGLAIGAGALLR